MSIMISNDANVLNYWRLLLDIS